MITSRMRDSKNIYEVLQTTHMTMVFNENMHSSRLTYRLSHDRNIMIEARKSALNIF